MRQATSSGLRKEAGRRGSSAGGPGEPVERGYTFEFKVAFWLVAGFTLVSFLLWLALPGGHRAVPVLECTWPALLTSFGALVFGKLA